MCYEVVAIIRFAMNKTKQYRIVTICNSDTVIIDW